MPPAKPKMAAMGPENGQWGMKWVHPLIFGHSDEFFTSKFFDESTPSTGKETMEEKKTKGEENHDRNSGFYIISS